MKMLKPSRTRGQRERESYQSLQGGRVHCDWPAVLSPVEEEEGLSTSVLEDEGACVGKVRGEGCLTHLVG